MVLIFFMPRTVILSITLRGNCKRIIWLIIKKTYYEWVSRVKRNRSIAIIYVPEKLWKTISVTRYYEWLKWAKRLKCLFIILYALKQISFKYGWIHYNKYVTESVRKNCNKRSQAITSYRNDWNFYHESYRKESAYEMLIRQN